jgi:hypothetical protein
MKDVKKEFKELLHKQDESLIKGKLIIKLKGNSSQERVIRETVIYTAGETEVPEPDATKEKLFINRQMNQQG